MTWRVNWNDKAGNIRAIAEELGFAPTPSCSSTTTRSSASAFAASCRRSRSGARSCSRCAASC